MKKIIRIFIIISIITVSLIAFTACGYGEKKGTIVDKKGTIVDKKYTEKYTTHSSSIHRAGKATFVVPRTIHHPEKYELYIEKEEDGNIKGCWIQITEEEYNKYQIGDYYGE